MDKRIVRFEDEFWKIRTDVGDLPASEQKELRKYFDEIGMPYRIIAGGLCVSGDVERDAIFERVEHFYDGRAEVYPF